MVSTAIREELHSYINRADDRILHLLYAMVQADISDNYALTPEEREEIDKRIANHQSGKSRSSTWEEVKSRLRG